MKKTFFSILLVLIVIGSSACNLINRPQALTEAELSSLLTIDQVRAGDSPGQFVLSGLSSLPEQTRLTVSAVRVLTSNLAVDGDDASLLYGILARKTARIEAGRWQSTLNLWQPNANGLYQEPWQSQSNQLTSTLSPNPEVDFLLTVEPKDYTQAVANLLPNRPEAAVNQVLHFTPSGEPYLRVSQILPVALPNNVQAFTLDNNPDQPSPWDGRNTLDSTSTAIQREVEIPFLGDDNLPLSSDRLLR